MKDNGPIILECYCGQTSIAIVWGKTVCPSCGANHFIPNPTPIPPPHTAGSQQPVLRH